MNQDVAQESLFDEVADTSESEQDLSPIKQNEINQAVVNGTDWTVETIISQIDKGNIQLNPKFQRRDAWENDRKSKFIESLILGFPVPQLVLAEVKGKKGAYIVIDGKQRLLSIRQFASKNDDTVYAQLKLRDLKLRSELVGMCLEDIRQDAGLDDDLRAFENSPIRTVVIKNWPSESFLYHVFLRLNTGSLPLSPQELRQALHPGPFVDYADETASNSDALREILKSKGPDFRMRDVELLVRFYAFYLFMGDYTGDLKGMLDHASEQLNARWQAEEDQLRKLSEEFEEAYKTAKTIFGEKTVFRKWAQGSYESRFNRAIFDIVMHYFAKPHIREAALAKSEDVELGFKELCANDPEFLGSIEKTTKSLGATYIRFSKWSEMLRNILGVDIHVPSFENGRII